MNAGAGLWWLSCLPEAAAFWRACGRVPETQRGILNGILRAASPSWFGRKHGFQNLSEVADFQAAVPLSQYDDYAEAIARIAAGESGVLTAQPVLLFEPTSGSLGGTKHIPYTAGLKREFQRGLAPWIADLFGRRPGLMGGRSYWSISPPAERLRRGCIPVGFEDDASYLSGWSAGMVRRMLAVPQLPAQHPDFLDYTLERLILCPDLRLVSVWSPTFWTLLTERLLRSWDDLASRPELGSALRRAERHPQGRLRGLWPALRCISCWGEAYSAAYLADLRKAFPGCWIQPKGLLSTEAFATLPIGERSVLSLRSHFFEFLDSNGRARLAHELLMGATYELVVTTSGGLYRYRTGDLVRLTGYLRENPALAFEGRLGVVDRFGEKLSLLEVARALSGFSGPAMVAFEEGPRAYTLFSAEASRETAASLEQALLTNFHYRCCRELNQLGPVAAFRLKEGSTADFYARMERLGIRAGDSKPLPLRQEADWSQWLRGEFVP